MYRAPSPFLAPSYALPSLPVVLMLMTCADVCPEEQGSKEESFLDVRYGAVGVPIKRAWTHVTFIYAPNRLKELIRFRRMLI